MSIARRIERAALLTAVAALGLRLRRANRRAMIDVKTGVLTAASWQVLAARELARARRSDSSVAVLMLDLDRFKLVNDLSGHLAGDRLLGDVGRRLGETVRGYDVVGRFGGDEFVVLAPDVTLDQALEIAERLREAIDAGSRVTVSVGVAHGAARSREFAAFQGEADAALRAAKTAGGDRVVAAD